MRYFLIATVPLLVCVCALSQVTDGAQRPGTAKSVLQETVPHYQLSDANLRDALAVLSMSSVRGLHLGFEEILRGKIMDPVDQSVRFSLHLENNTVDEILNALCQSDPRYVWSLDGLTINVYPKRSTTDSSYFMNLLIAQISFKDVTDSDHALGPLDTEFPEQQVGYMEMGGDNSYSKPWTATFDNLTVRQFVNRIAEHMGSQTSWIWQGGNNERMFTFHKGGFHTATSDRQFKKQ